MWAWHAVGGGAGRVVRRTGYRLIFTGTKRVADELTRDMRRDGFPALAIHGDKTQPERDWVLAEFKSGRAPLMVATVAGWTSQCATITSAAVATGATDASTRTAGGWVCAHACLSMTSHSLGSGARVWRHFRASSSSGSSANISCAAAAASELLHTRTRGGHWRGVWSVVYVPPPLPPHLQLCRREQLDCSLNRGGDRNPVGGNGHTTIRTTHFRCRHTQEGLEITPRHRRIGALVRNTQNPCPPAAARTR